MSCYIDAHERVQADSLAPLHGQHIRHVAAARSSRISHPAVPRACGRRFRNPPPPGRDEKRHLAARSRLSRPPVVLTPALRPSVPAEIVASLREHEVEVLAACVSSMPMQVLARFPRKPTFNERGLRRRTRQQTTPRGISSALPSNGRPSNSFAPGWSRSRSGRSAARSGRSQIALTKSMSSGTSLITHQRAQRYGRFAMMT
jgi:hypothetical protein